MKCKNCQEPLAKTDKFCKNCAAPNPEFKSLDDRVSALEAERLAKKTATLDDQL